MQRRGRTSSPLVIEAASDSLSDLLQAITVWARNTPGVAVVSMSWGESEFPNESAFDTYFTTPAGHVGMSFVARPRSGDTPSAPNGRRCPPTSSRWAGPR